ncbi:hypothetical protein DPMN_040662 [Dreissena polymorpha]|uniref:Uncharacterized protein n=1 Tax=Dreissena polymorpha TaxID=45954 RepID=A0A9D4CYQ9_DREPO|nr:hypothetical protein DPMN_040662 [Dreissena polymorpha]
MSSLAFAERHTSSLVQPHFRNVVRLCQNPYAVTVNVPLPLHDLLTKLAVDKEVAERLRKCIENGERVYRVYRQERIVEKAKKKSVPPFQRESFPSSLTI